MSFFSRLRIKYKLVILNENQLEEKFHTHISMLSIIAWTGLICLVTFVLLSALILFTPIKYFLPGYAEVSIREEVVNEALRVDSMAMQLESADRQLLILKNIIAGNIEIDSINTTDTLTLEQLRQLPIGPTQQEHQFNEQYEENNRYNINDYLPTNSRPEEVVFVIPVHGAIQEKFNLLSHRHGIRIVASSDKPVLAIQGGTIIYSDNKSTTDNTLVIYHDNDFISIYRHLGRLLHRSGDNVLAGEAIAFVGNEETTHNDINNTIVFELWYKATPIDPEKYIAF